MTWYTCIFPKTIDEIRLPSFMQAFNRKNTFKLWNKMFGSDQHNLYGRFECLQFPKTSQVEAVSRTWWYCARLLKDVSDLILDPLSDTFLTSNGTKCFQDFCKYMASFVQSPNQRSVNERFSPKYPSTILSNLFTKMVLLSLKTLLSPLCEKIVYVHGTVISYMKVPIGVKVDFSKVDTIQHHRLIRIVASFTPQRGRFQRFKMSGTLSHRHFRHSSHQRPEYQAHKEWLRVYFLFTFLLSQGQRFLVILRASWPLSSVNKNQNVRG